MLLGNPSVEDIQSGSSSCQRMEGAIQFSPLSLPMSHTKTKEIIQSIKVLTTSPGLSNQEGFELERQGREGDTLNSELSSGNASVILHQQAMTSVGEPYVSVSLPALTGGWQQSSADIPERRKMVVKVIKIIKKKIPDAEDKVKVRVPLIAKKLERYLYRSAATKAQYTDPLTLERRLQQVAHRISLASKSSIGENCEGYHNNM